MLISAGSGVAGDSGVENRDTSVQVCSTCIAALKITHACCRWASHQIKFLTLDPVPCLPFTYCHGLGFRALSVPEVPIKQFHICVWCLRVGTLAILWVMLRVQVPPNYVVCVRIGTHKNYFNTVASIYSL